MEYRQGHNWAAAVWVALEAKAGSGERMRDVADDYAVDLSARRLSEQKDTEVLRALYAAAFREEVGVMWQPVRSYGELVRALEKGMLQGDCFAVCDTSRVSAYVAHVQAVDIPDGGVAWAVMQTKEGEEIPAQMFMDALTAQRAVGVYVVMSDPGGRSRWAESVIE